MNKDKKLVSLIRFIVKYLIIGLILSGSVLLICYFTGKRSLGSISDILTYVGAVILAVGFCSILGTRSTTADLNNVQYARSAGDASSSTRLKQDFELINGAYGFMIKAVIVSIVPFVLSIILF